VIPEIKFPSPEQIPGLAMLDLHSNSELVVIPLISGRSGIAISHVPTSPSESSGCAWFVTLLLYARVSFGTA